MMSSRSSRARLDQLEQHDLRGKLRQRLDMHMIKPHSTNPTWQLQPKWHGIGGWCNVQTPGRHKYGHLTSQEHLAKDCAEAAPGICGLAHHRIVSLTAVQATKQNGLWLPTNFQEYVQLPLRAFACRMQHAFQRLRMGWPMSGSVIDPTQGSLIWAAPQMEVGSARMNRFLCKAPRLRRHPQQQGRAARPAQGWGHGTQT